MARLGASGTASGQTAMEAGGRQELARLDGGTDDPIANIDKPWGVWTAGYGQVGQLAGDGNAHRLDETISGGSVGADYKLLPALKVGAGLGYGGTTFSLDDGGGRGQVDHTQFAIYADYTMGPVYLDGTMGVAYGDGTTRRNVSLPGLPGQAQGHVTDTQFMGSVEAGYGLKLGRVTATPFAGAGLGLGRSGCLHRNRCRRARPACGEAVAELGQEQPRRPDHERPGAGQCAGHDRRLGRLGARVRTDRPRRRGRLRGRAHGGLPGRRGPRCRVIAR